MDGGCLFGYGFVDCDEIVEDLWMVRESRLFVVEIMVSWV